MSTPHTFSVDKLTTYRARNNDTWRVVYLDGNDPEYPVVALDSKGVPNTFTADGQSITGKETEFDLVAPAVEDPAPFRITGPGEYRMRNGQKAVVTSVSDRSPWPFKGNCRYGGSSWLENGSNSPSGENSSMDIIAKWEEEPAPFAITAPGSYVTRDGRKAVVLCVDAPGKRSVIGYINKEAGAFNWDLAGVNVLYEQCDITGPWIERPEPVVFDRWVNAYADGYIGDIYRSKQDADIAAGIACDGGLQPDNRIACHHLRFKGADVEIVKDEGER